MTKQEQQEAAKAFADEWENKEDFDNYDDYKKAFWTAILKNTYNISYAENLFEFMPTPAVFDFHIPLFGVAVTQKPRDIDINELTEYFDNSISKVLKFKDEHSQDIKLDYYIVCNYKTFLIYDLTQSEIQFDEFSLSDFANSYNKLPFKVTISD